MVYNYHNQQKHHKNNKSYFKKFLSINDRKSKINFYLKMKIINRLEIPFND